MSNPSDSSSPSLVHYLFAGGRALIGLGSLVAPSVTRSIVGLQYRQPDQTPLDLTVITALFGVRDLVHGAVIVSSDVRTRLVALRAALAVDLLDTAASTVIAVTHSGAETYSGRLLFFYNFGAAAFAAIGYYLIQKDQKKLVKKL
jgi:hypothetical protein